MKITPKEKSNPSMCRAYTALHYLIKVFFFFLISFIICSSTIGLICNPLKVQFPLTNLFLCTSWSCTLKFIFMFISWQFLFNFQVLYLVLGRDFESLCPQDLETISSIVPSTQAAQIYCSYTLYRSGVTCSFSYLC